MGDKLAVEEMEALRAFDRRRVLAEIRGQLTDQPNVATRCRKCLLDMKTIPANELTTNLDAVLRSSQSERIVIVRDGKPCAVLVVIQDYDAEDLALATSVEFWRMIRHRRTQDDSIPLA